MGKRPWHALQLLRAQAEAPQTSDGALQALLEALPMDWLLVSASFRIAAASSQSSALGITDAQGLSDKALRRLVTGALRTRAMQEMDLDIGGAEHAASPRHVRARACPLDHERTVVLIEDVSHPLRVDAMRRDFIVNVSHELKTPVGALLLLAEAARSAGDDRAALNRFIDRMHTEAERLGRLVNDLTDLSRLQAMEPPQRAHVAVARLFAEAADSVALIAGNRGVEILVADAKDLGVEGDEDQLVTAMRNLLLNAVMYSPANTRVTVTARARGERVELSVSDQGIGISEVEQQRIFERFYRVDPARSRATGGTGLGLAIVKHIATLHGGECVVWSRPGEGSTFTLRLRRSHGDSTTTVRN